MSTTNHPSGIVDTTNVVTLAKSLRTFRNFRWRLGLAALWVAMKLLRAVRIEVYYPPGLSPQQRRQLN